MVSPHLLHIDASYSSRTYLGVLTGRPSVQHSIDQAKRQAKELWGERPTLVIDPTIKGKRLPEWVHMVWARGPEKDPDNHGSHLVIIWWSEMQPDTDRVLAAVDWE